MCEQLKKVRSGQKQDGKKERSKHVPKKRRDEAYAYKLKQHYGWYCLKKKTFLTTTIYTSV